jgi:hypothetical protein
MDRALELVPDDVDTRVNRALLNLDLQADTRPLHGNYRGNHRQESRCRCGRR